MNRRCTRFQLGGLVSLATFLLYLPTLWADFVLWDDPRFVVDNVKIRSLDLRFLRWAFTDLDASYWHPVAWISHAVDYRLWGLHPAGHHFTNNLLHAANTFLVSVLVALLVRVWGRGSSAGGPLPGPSERFSLIVGGVTGTLFGIHPLHVESVAWVTERKDLLCGLFFLLSIATYVGFAVARRRGKVGGKHRAALVGQYWGSVAFAALALASKPVAVSLPLVLLLLDWYPFRAIRCVREFVAACIGKVPFVILSGAVSLATISAEQRVGALASVERFPLAERILVAGKALVTYLGRMALPVDLSPFYPFPTDVSPGSPAYVVPVILVGVATFACIRARTRNPLWGAAWGYYVVTIFPMLQVLQAGYQNMTDRSNYLPSLGPFLLVGLGAARVWEGGGGPVARQGRRGVLLIGSAVCLAVALGWLATRQMAVWHDTVALWSRVIQRDPGRVPIAYINRGAAYLKNGALDLAMEDLNTAIGLGQLSDLAYVNRGLVFERLRRRDLAIADYTRALALNSRNREAHLWRAALYEGGGRDAEAIADYTAAIGLSPSPGRIFTARGNAYARMGHLDLAMGDFGAAISLDPSLDQAYVSRGSVHDLMGDYEGAMEDYTAAVELNPSRVEAYERRGDLHAASGNPDGALEDYRRACALGSEAGCEAVRRHSRR